MEKKRKKQRKPGRPSVAPDDLKVSTAISLDRSVLKSLQKSPLGVSGEIRRRLELTSGDDETLKLLEIVSGAAVWTSIETGHKWHAHPAAHRVLRQTILSNLARVKPDGDPAFRPDELPKHRVVAPGSADPQEIGMALEAFLFHQAPMTPELQRLLDQKLAEAKREILMKRQGDNNGEG